MNVVQKNFMRLLLLALLLNIVQVTVALGNGPRGVRKSVRTQRRVSRQLQSDAEIDEDEATDEPETLPEINEDEGDEEEEEDKKKNKEAKKKKKSPSSRECSVSQSNDEIKFKCKAKTSGDDGSEIKDAIKYKVASPADEPLLIEVDYEQEIETVTNETETETETTTKFEVEFVRVIEYRKADTVEVSSASDSAMAYEWGKDIVVQETMLDAWNAFTPIIEDGALSMFSVSTADDIATFNFTIARTDTGNITVNKMKIDFDLSGYEWNASDTFVALICTVTSERTIEIEVDNEADTAADVKISFEDAVDTVGFTPFGEYTWADFAEAGNMTESDTVAVVATSPANVNSTEIAFSFVGTAAQNASNIFWDPEAGIGYGDAVVTDDAPAGSPTDGGDQEAGPGTDGNGDGDGEGGSDGDSGAVSAGFLMACIATVALSVVSML